MSVRTLHCSNNVENYNLCLDHNVVGFGHRGPLSGDIIYILIKNGKKTFCGARCELDDVTDNKPWEDADKYVLCYTIKNIEFCNFFDVSFLSEIGGKYWALKYLQGSKTFDDTASNRLYTEFEKNKCIERQNIEVEKLSDDENEEILDDKEVEEILKEVPDAEIKIMGTFQTVNFQNETDKFKGLETLVTKNFFQLFTNYKAERTILISKNRLFRTHQMEKNVSEISSIPDALLITFDSKNKLQISNDRI